LSWSRSICERVPLKKNEKQNSPLKPLTKANHRADSQRISMASP
jgi:hypothetical protein